MRDTIPEFGQFLESLRGGMSLREAAKKSGLSHAYIRDLELERNRSTNDKITPSPSTLKKLSAAYGYPYTELMIKAGHLKEQEVPVSAKAKEQIDLSAVFYIEIGAKEIICGNDQAKVVKHIDSLKDFSQFIDVLDELKFTKVDAGLYVNFRHIRKYDEQCGKLFFDTDGEGLYVTLSAFHQHKFHDLIHQKVAGNKTSSSKSAYDNNSRQSL